jgi:ABC-type multidrug transport system fused ATPase/permease subunit
MPPKQESYFWRFIREFVLPHRWITFLLVCNVLLQVCLSFWTPYAIKEMIDRVLLPHGTLTTAGTENWGLALWLLFSMAGVIGANKLLSYLFNRLSFKLVAYISQVLRTRVADRLFALSQEYYDSSQIGRLLMTALGDPSNITQQLTMGMINALAQGCVVLGGCLILFWIDVPLSSALVTIFPLMVAAFFIMRPKMVAISGKTRENWGIISGMVAEKVGGIRLVRSFAAEDLESQRFSERTYYHRDLNFVANRYASFYTFLNGLCIHLGYTMVFLVGGWLFFKHRITMGTIAAFYFYFNRLYPAVLAVCNLPQQVLSARGSLDKVFVLLDEPLLIVNRPGAKPFDEPLREIVFEEVSFRYGPQLPQVLNKLSLKIMAGSQVGIVGPSGSGKSTLMALLLRFYEPEQGRILVNGRDLRDWEMHSLRRAFALVPQEQMLFTGTIRENVVYTREKSDDATIWKALEEAEATEFVRELEGGLDSVVGEKGVSLSGGQKQRLAIARALLARPQCLILDNCTSALDGHTEQRLQATLRQVLVGRSAIIISHRASSVSHCNQVLVLDGGRLVEQGSAEELGAASGYFSAIQRQQAGS